MVKRGSAGSTCRRLAAGEAEHGGESALVCSGDQMSGGGRLRVAGSKPQLLVVVVELGVAGNGASDELGGHRSAAEVEHDARGTARRVEWCYGFLRVR